MTESGRRDATPFTLRSLTLSVYLPTFIFSIGQGAVLPVIPLFARDLGGSVATAGLIVAMRGLGRSPSTCPAGWPCPASGTRGRWWQAPP